MSWPIEDKELAKHALQEIESARLGSSAEAVRRLKPLMREIGRRPNDPFQRADAWLAVCALAQKLEKHGATSDWNNATDKVRSWLRQMD